MRCFGAFAELKTAVGNRHKNREEIVVRRRELFKGAAVTLAALAAPRIGRAERPNKLVFVPPEDLSVLDPVVTSLRSTRNQAYLVFDTLYGIDTNWAAQPQMVEGHQVEEDGRIWTLTLRDGLLFHDKEPVLARDVVASIRRFAARVSLANALMAATEELSAPDDRTVRFHLKRPFPHLPEALAGPGGIVLTQARETADFDAIWPGNPTFNHFHFCFLAVNVRSLDVILGAVSKCVICRPSPYRFLPKHELSSGLRTIGEHRDPVSSQPALSRWVQTPRRQSGLRHRP